MSNTPAESVAVVQPRAQETPVSETPQQSKKFDNVHKSVASKAKAFLHVFHSAGENIRGNINAALDGAGDAIAGRKPGEAVGRKSGEQTTRSSVEPTLAEPAPAPAAVEATTETPAPIEAPAATPADAQAEVPAVTVVPETNAATDSTTEANAEKRFPVGQFLNLRFKRTVDLVMRVGGSLRSKSTRTAETLGSSLVEGKQRASRRFSRVPKAAPAEAAPAEVAPAEVALAQVPEAIEPTPLPALAETPLPVASADPPAQTTS